MADVLRADEITFGYEHRVPLLFGWTEHFRAGEVVGITGPSGRGKSTLLYILGIMLRPDRGEIYVDGRPVAHSPDACRAWLRANRYGFVFQDAALDVTRSVIDNVLETSLYRGRRPRDDMDRARELLDRFGVGLLGDAKPTQVSGGQAQRIALCRALLSQPAIVLADEPTGNLDADSSSAVVAALKQQAGSGAAVIVVTHDPGLVAQCDREVRL